jgi:hypothetical protein
VSQVRSQFYYIKHIKIEFVYRKGHCVLQIQYAPRTASSVVTRFLAADSAAAASTGFSLKLFAISIRDATVFVEPRKNLMKCVRRWMACYFDLIATEKKNKLSSAAYLPLS